MKDAFETVAGEMGGNADVDVEVMYPGFKFGRWGSCGRASQQSCDKNRPSF